MKFGVIYSIDWNSSEFTEDPFESYEEAADLLPLFHKTESTEYDPEGGEHQELHAKYAGIDLLTQTQFEHFLRVTRMVASQTPTLGSIIGYAWGMGWTAPAVRFFSYSKQFEEIAYVTPVPEVEIRRERSDEEQWRAWERVRDAVVRMYEKGVGEA